MQGVLDSSWMRFGPAGRGSYDWVPGTPTPPDLDTKLQGLSHSELDPSRYHLSQLLLYAGLPIASLLVLALLFAALRRRLSRGVGSLSRATVIRLDPRCSDSSLDFLCSLRGYTGRNVSTSSGGSDAAFLMVYLPYETS